MTRRILSALLLEAVFAVVTVQVQTPAGNQALAAQVDSIAQQVLRNTGVPSASVAVVQHGKLVYANAYGAAKLEPRVPATADMRYGIGSISKQFTASAILLL